VRTGSANDAAPTAVAPDDTSRFTIEGEIVQICDGPRQHWARIVVTGATMVQALPAGVAGLHLGDRVVLECAITVERVRPSPDQRNADAE
jgi:hypothetical protein